jgi:hypothetical protein
MSSSIPDAQPATYANCPADLTIFGISGELLVTVLAAPPLLEFLLPQTT